MNNHTWWYIARSGGIIAWVLLAISMFWGLALSSRFLGKRPKPNWMLDLHRFVGGLATVFTLVHVVALMLDTYVGFSLANVLVPFTGSYHPLAVGWGVIAMYFLIAVEITSLLRKKLSKRAWRATHYLSFPLFALASLHGLQAGSDRTARPFVVANIVVIVLVAALTAMRLQRAEHHDLMVSPPAPR